MAGPECTLSQLRKVREKPPTWLVVCSCGRWSRRVVGSEEKAKQRQIAHRNLILIEEEDPQMMAALDALRSGGIGFDLEHEEDHAAAVEEEDSADSSGSDHGRRGNA
jgi:hypothetical protein